MSSSIRLGGGQGPQNCGRVEVWRRTPKPKARPGQKDQLQQRESPLPLLPIAVDHRPAELHGREAREDGSDDCRSGSRWFRNTGFSPPDRRDAEAPAQFLRAFPPSGVSLDALLACMLGTCGKQVMFP